MNVTVLLVSRLLLLHVGSQKKRQQELFFIIEKDMEESIPC